MQKKAGESAAKLAGPPEELVAELIDKLGRTFDLTTAVGGRTLADAMEDRIRSLRPGGPARWGLEGDIREISRLETGPLDFYYRPHLFPDMDPALRLGHLLQFDLLPRSLPARSPLRIAAVLESYCHLSGDLLGWRLEGDELFVWMADVSGHGVRAGLAAAVLYFLVAAVEPGYPLARFARRINDSMLAARNPSDRRSLFATAVWLRVGSQGRGTFASSGHPPMLLRRASGEIEELTSTGRPLGILPRQSFDQVEFRLGPGDSLCLFTDGLIEATDADGNEFDSELLAGLLRGCSAPPLATTRAIYRAVGEHKDLRFLDDDLTFLVAGPALDAPRRPVSSGLGAR